MIQMRWYFRPITVVIAILCVGPLALPLLWVIDCDYFAHSISFSRASCFSNSL